MKRICLFLFLSVIHYVIIAQAPTPFILKGTLKESRQQAYRNIVKNTITKSLSLPLTEPTEQQWQDAFWAMEVINYRSAWVDNKIYAAFEKIHQRSITFQRALLELAYTNYPDVFFTQVKSLSLETKDAKIFAMCTIYLLYKDKHDVKEKGFLFTDTKKRVIADENNPILLQLQAQIQKRVPISLKKYLSQLFSKDFLPGNVIMFSLQRENRDYPGIVIIRNADGNFIKEDNHLFCVPQLARSASNLPGYLTNGNTPEGIFRMDGFDTSASSFIGPTTNIQLSMPFENKASHFYKDSSLTDSMWDIDRYKKLLPEDLQHYYPLYQSYFAGKAGRTEIIAHGTTIDPTYYKNKPYYPLTPTQGCLSTKEMWNDETGMLKESDQQKLANAIIKAGGPNGYAIVINIDDKPQPVTLAEISDFILSSIQK